jgi:hypothetical protein
MSYNLYKARANEVIKDSKKIENLEERVEYLFKAKREFTANNSGPDVRMIVSIYDSEIELTKFKLQQMQNKPNKELYSPGGNEIDELPKVIEHKPPKVTVAMLKPELQAIFDELPHLIDYCERNGQRLAEQIIEEIKEEIAIQPEQREQIIISHRDKLIIRYKELINSGLRLKATDKEEIIQKISLYMVATGTWKIPLPKDCSFESLNPEPKGHIKTALARLFNNYAIIQACNGLLKPDEPATTTPEAQVPDAETTEQKIKEILEPIRRAFDNSGHIDFIVKALAECFEDKEYSNRPIRATAIYESLEKFYEPFVNVWKNIGLTPGKIGEVLNRHIFMHNGKREEISPGTARKHIYTIGKKLATVTDRNRP